LAFATSETASIALESALFKFNRFLRDSLADRKEKLERSWRPYKKCELMIWGNGRENTHEARREMHVGREDYYV
jgi:hypothetical protein